MGKKDETSESEALNESRKEIILIQEKYRLALIKSIEKNNNKFWTYLNSNFVTFILTAILLSLIPFLYQNRQLSKEKEVRQNIIINSIDIRINLIMPLVDKAISTSVLTDESRYDISNSFTGQMKQPFDEFGSIGIPGLLLKLAVFQKNKKLVMDLDAKYLMMMPEMEKNNLYARGGGFGDVNLNKYQIKILQKFKSLLEEIKKLKLEN